MGLSVRTAHFTCSGVDDVSSDIYTQHVAVILTPREQQEVASIAWQLGGYGEMLRLGRELKAMKAAGKRPKMALDLATGRREIVEA